MKKLPYSILLASQSPRRQLLLKEMGLQFKVKVKDIEETFPSHLKEKNIALYLCKKKANAFTEDLKANELLITADTIVCIGSHVLNKPANYNEAVKMLSLLSGKTHVVYTGVCLTHWAANRLRQKTFSVSTHVTFHKLSKQQIDLYVRHYQPFDKAGSYGAQECLPNGINPCSLSEKKFLSSLKKPHLYLETQRRKKGFVLPFEMIEKITGSYFNVMGLPIVALHKNLMQMKINF
jgi:septum formation protein